jgi:hypothetical protein
LRQHGAGELAGAAADRAEQRPLWIGAQSGAVEISGEIFLEVVMARHRVALAAFLAQPYPKTTVLRVDVLNRHAECGTDARKRIDHQRDQGAVAHPGVIGGVDAVEQRTRFRRIEHKLT